MDLSQFLHYLAHSEKVPSIKFAMFFEKNAVDLVLSSRAIRSFYLTEFSQSPIQFH